MHPRQQRPRHVHRGPLHQPDEAGPGPRARGRGADGKAAGGRWDGGDVGVAARAGAHREVHGPRLKDKVRHLREQPPSRVQHSATADVLAHRPALAAARLRREALGQEAPDQRGLSRHTLFLRLRHNVHPRFPDPGPADPAPPAGRAPDRGRAVRGVAGDLLRRRRKIPGVRGQKPHHTRPAPLQILGVLGVDARQLAVIHE